MVLTANKQTNKKKAICVSEAFHSSCSLSVPQPRALPGQQPIAASAEGHVWELRVAACRPGAEGESPKLVFLAEFCVLRFVERGFREVPRLNTTRSC